LGLAAWGIKTLSDIEAPETVIVSSFWQEINLGTRISKKVWVQFKGL
jgi:hypothetical protein